MGRSNSQLIQALDFVQSPQEVYQLVRDIAERGESAIPDLLLYEKTLFKNPGKYRTVMQIYQLMGYPTNRLAIHSIVSQASRINSPGWDIAVNILIGIGERAIPELREAFHFYFKDLDEYSLEIQGLCVALDKIGSPPIDLLLPELVYLLENGTDENHVDEYALWPVKRIGSPKANAAVKVLSKIISSKRGERIRELSIQSLQKFEMSVVSPFASVLRECLSDPSEVVRTRAMEVLSVLGK